MDSVFALPYQRVPHPAYGNARIPAYEMIRFSINIMRGCFGGCSFCSSLNMKGRIIQSPLGTLVSTDRSDPRHGAGVYRRDLRSGRSYREHVYAAL